MVIARVVSWNQTCISLQSYISPRTTIIMPLRPIVSLSRDVYRGPLSRYLAKLVFILMADRN